MRKWNYETKEYDLYSVPEDWNCPLCEDLDDDNVDKKVNCVNCGKEMRFGDVCDSHEIRTLQDSPYGVCVDCYYKERQRLADLYKNL